MDELGFYHIRFNTNSILKWKVCIAFISSNCDAIELDMSNSNLDDFYEPIGARILNNPYKDGFISHRISNEQFCREYSWEILFFKFYLSEVIKAELLKAKDLFDFALVKTFNFSFYKGNECFLYSILSKNTLCVKLTSKQMLFFKSKGIVFVKPELTLTSEQIQNSFKRHQKKIETLLRVCNGLVLAL